MIYLYFLRQGNLYKCNYHNKQLQLFCIIQAQRTIGKSDKRHELPKILIYIIQIYVENCKYWKFVLVLWYFPLSKCIRTLKWNSCSRITSQDNIVVKNSFNRYICPVSNAVLSKASHGRDGYVLPPL